ncbi:MAG: CRISPR-associated helicase Cas3' [Thiohalomonadaceae bacterium]
MPWGKWVSEENFHTLADHCLDVAITFRRMLGLPLLARLGGLTEGQKDRLAVIAFLHDFGKCNRGFQAKADPRIRDTAGHVREAVVVLQSEALRERWPHDWTALIDDLCGWFTTGGEGAAAMLLAAVSHHGQPIRWEEPGLHLLEKYWLPGDDYDPLHALGTLARAAREAFPAAFDTDVPSIDATGSLQQRFAGLLMLADWIASDTGFFPYRAAPDEDRERLAGEQADRALTAIGLIAPPTRIHLNLSTDEGFRAAFALPEPAKPSPLQTLLARALPVDESSRLVLIESETGSGKTEAALAWFLRLYGEGRVDGLYFALPTRVAARELYGRVLTTVEHAFAPEAIPRPVLLAAPGYVRVDGQPVLADPDGTLWDDDETARCRERLWAAERPKRFLAAPIAVGTIDQALLSVLKTKHSLLRSVCLDRHLLVVDEVHASDTYMREVLRALLAGHLRRGGWALMLSATLGEAAASTFFGRERRPLIEASRRPYPSLTTRGQEYAVPAGRASRRISIELSHTLSDDEALLRLLAEALRSGARVLVVCNTVGRANTLLRAIEAHLATHAPQLLDALFTLQGVRCPHHGRFARADRELLDAQVSERLGKGTADGPLLLIGTQTLEQSLDIDADWLVTDLAPMDVLLQRLGRLHRHSRTRRPVPFDLPRALVRVPDKPLHEWLAHDGTLCGLAGLGTVYADGRVLACTLASLVRDPSVLIPEQNRQRIEDTTHPDAWDALTEPWKAHALYMEGKFLEELRQALRNVQADEPFGELHYGNVDDGKVMTRLGDPTYDIPLDHPHRSSFGVEIDRIPVPVRFLKGTPAPERLTVESIQEGLRFVIGPHAFRYTRFGLEKDDA